MRSALQKKVAHVATNTTVAIPKRPNGCDQAPRPTAQASPMAIAANTKARLLYGRPAPYSAVKAPIEATNPAGTSPTLQPKATGAATQKAAPREYGQRFGTMRNRTTCRSRKDAGREGGGKWSIYITEGLGRGGARIRIAAYVSILFVPAATWKVLGIRSDLVGLRPMAGQAGRAAACALMPLAARCTASAVACP